MGGTKKPAAGASRTTKPTTVSGRPVPSNCGDPLVEFAIKWSHFGGGSSEDIFVTFGIEPRQYFERLLTSLTSVDIDPVSHHEISAVAHRRLRAMSARQSDTPR